MSDAFADALEMRRLQVEEYGQYTAAERITNQFGTVIYNAGYPVPAGNVEKDGSIIIDRHACPGVDPNSGRQCTIEHNAIMEKTGPGMAVKVKKTATPAGGSN